MPPTTRPDPVPGATVEVVLEEPRWAEAGLEDIAQSAVDATLLALGLPPGPFEVSLLACNDARIAELNTAFRNKPGPTNVLSWPSQDRAAAVPGARPAAPDPDDPAAAELGDIAIAYETCAREAEAAGLRLRAHALHLMVHGTLHLLGFDHITEPDAALMEGLEVRILAELGVADPYQNSVL